MLFTQLPLLLRLLVPLSCTGIWLFCLVFYLPFLGYLLTLLCAGFDKVILSDQGPLALKYSATSNLSMLTKNVFPSRYIPLIYFLKITLATSVFARFIPTTNIITNKFHIHFSTAPHYSYLSGHTSKSCLYHVFQLNFKLCFTTLFFWLSLFQFLWPFFILAPAMPGVLFTLVPDLLGIHVSVSPSSLGEDKKKRKKKKAISMQAFVPYFILALQASRLLT